MAPEHDIHRIVRGSFERVVCDAVRRYQSCLTCFPVYGVTLVIDDARGRINEKCVACLVAYRTTALAYKWNTETKKFQLTRGYRNTVLSGELKIVKGKNIKIFFSPILTQAQKVKAYLIKGARQLPGYDEWPNPQLGWGALCLEDSLPL